MMGRVGLAVGLALVALAAGAAEARREWAVLVCGSRGYFNYRHHADVCHAYQTLKRRGIPDERIITMMYDDVANDQRNPFPGKLFNRPSDGGNPIDVYAGCLKDYTGSAVTPAVFLDVIQGNAAKVDGLVGGSGKVLNSTEEDDVFINFVDHGAPGLVAFPDGMLHAEPLVSAIKVMHKRKMFRKLVFYLEACESGSMFQDLPSDIDVYAVTAANAQESSWATYCPPRDDIVNGVHMNTCLGDEFSVHWLEDTDAERPNKRETLLEQYQRVKSITKKSHVLDFGDVTKLGTNDISDFMGDPIDDGHPLGDVKHIDIHESALVDSRDVALVSTFYRYMRAPSKETQRELDAELAHRREADALFEAVARSLLQSEDEIKEALSAKPPARPREWGCYREAVAVVSAACDLGWSDYSLKYGSTLLALCDKIADRVPSGTHTGKLVSAIRAVCSPAQLA